jgi:hypothetical protein
VSNKPEMLSLRQAEMKLRKPDSYLMKLNTVSGAKYFVVPGGPVSDATARAILARPDIESRDNGLFPGVEQSWRIKRGKHS